VAPALYFPPDRGADGGAEAATALAASLALDDPQHDLLSGRVTIAARSRVQATLLDAAAGDPIAPIDCRRVLRPAAGIEGGVAYVNGSVGDAVLFDQDSFLACDDGRPDYELAEGACGTPGLSFTGQLVLTVRVPPFDVCVRPIADRSAEFDLTLETIAIDRLDLAAETEEPLVERTWAGRRPDPVPLELLDGAGGEFTLALSATDGLTPARRARAALRRQGEAALVFGQPPAVAALSDVRAECTAAAGTPVTLDGTGAADPDGDALAWVWLETAGDDARLLATGPGPVVTLAQGVHDLVLFVVDATGLAARRDFHVTVADTLPPAITRLDSSPALLWPPDHRLVPVHVAVGAEDACRGAARVSLLDVTSSEPDDAGADGRTTGDIVVRGSQGGADLLLRAERRANGPGRVYRVRFLVEDDAGHAREATVDVVVPSSAPAH
jgi:hypothetical protein